MVLHYLPVRPEQPAVPTTSPGSTISGARVGFVVGKAVGNSVVRHRVTRRLRAVAREELSRLPPTADLVVRARSEAATARSTDLRRDLSAGLDRLLAGAEPRVRSS